MEASLLHIHSILRYAVLFIIPICTVVAYLKWQQKKSYTKSDEILARINIGINHSQMLMGIILMTHSSNVSFASGSLSDHNNLTWSIIHPALMMMSIVFVSLALMGVRNKKDDSKKHFLSFSYNLSAFALLIIALAFSGRGIF